MIYTKLLMVLTTAIKAEIKLQGLFFLKIQSLGYVKFEMSVKHPSGAIK